MSWQDDVMIEQDKADAIGYMGEAERRDLYDDVSPDYEYEILKTNDPEGKKWEGTINDNLKKIKQAQYYKEWYKKNKNQVSARKKAKYNKEYFAQWREKNREKYNEYHREYKRKKRNLRLEKEKKRTST